MLILRELSPIDHEIKIQLRVLIEDKKYFLFVISFNSRVDRRSQCIASERDAQHKSRKEMKQTDEFVGLVQMVSVGRNNYQHPRISRVRR